MHNNQEFGFRLREALDSSTKEPDFSRGLVLTVPSTIHYSKGVKAKEELMDVTVEEDGGLIYFLGPGNAIYMVFEIEELRAIMRLFDVAESDE